MLGQASSRAVLGGSQRRICLWEGEVDGVIAFGGVESSGGDEEEASQPLGSFVSPLLQSQFFRTEKLDGILPVDKSTESGTQNIQFLSLLLVEVDLNQIFSNAIEVNVIIGP